MGRVKVEFLPGEGPQRARITKGLLWWRRSAIVVQTARMITYRYRDSYGFQIPVCGPEWVFEATGDPVEPSLSEGLQYTLKRHSQRARKQVDRVLDEASRCKRREREALNWSGGETAALPVARLVDEESNS